MEFGKCMHEDDPPHKWSAYEVKFVACTLNKINAPKVPVTGYELLTFSDDKLVNIFGNKDILRVRKGLLDLYSTSGGT